MQGKQSHSSLSDLFRPNKSKIFRSSRDLSCTRLNLLRFTPYTSKRCSNRHATIMSRMFAWASTMLKRRPLLTNTVIYATFYTAAETSQQTFNKYYTPEKPDYDVVSAARIVTVGSGVYAPSLYYWYKMLDSKFKGTGIKVVLTKLCADQFFITPILLAVFFTTMGIVEKREDIFEELKAKYVKTLIANECFWIPCQVLNFALLPPHLRVAYVASVSFIWINVLCFIKRQKSEPIS